MYMPSALTLPLLFLHLDRVILFSFLLRDGQRNRIAGGPEKRRSETKGIRRERARRERKRDPKEIGKEIKEEETQESSEVERARGRERERKAC